MFLTYFQKEKWLKFNHVEATVMEALEKLNDLGAHHVLWILELGLKTFLTDNFSGVSEVIILWV